LSFELTEEQQMLKSTIQKFMNSECPKSLVRELDERDEFPKDIFNKLKGLGITSLTVPEEYGGSGRRIVDAVVVGEEITRRYATLGWVFGMCIWYGGENVNQTGNVEQKRRLLPGLAQGKYLFAYALTEPNAGSDLSAIQTYATSKGDVYKLNGTKIFITGAQYADYMTTLVRTEGKPPSRDGLTMFFVDMKAKGITFRDIDKLGYKGSKSCEVLLDDVEMHMDDIVGGPATLNKGWEVMMKTLDTERIAVAVSGLGVAQGALDISLDYAKNRVQFGKQIGKHQAIRHMLADMALDVQLARLATFYAASLSDRNQPCTMECNMAKLHAGEAAKRAALNGLQIMGAYGYCMENDIQRYVRDAIFLPIGGGTSQILRNAIASGLGL
jgi:alkylation response protein AidB-like acyl-CoA dehydrogenase